MAICRWAYYLIFVSLQTLMLANMLPGSQEERPADSRSTSRWPYGGIDLSVLTLRSNIFCRDASPPTPPEKEPSCSKAAVVGKGNKAG